MSGVNGLMHRGGAAAAARVPSLCSYLEKVWTKDTAHGALQWLLLTVWWLLLPGGAADCAGAVHSILGSIQAKMLDAWAGKRPETRGLRTVWKAETVRVQQDRLRDLSTAVAVFDAGRAQRRGIEICW